MKKTTTRVTMTPGAGPTTLRLSRRAVLQGLGSALAAAPALSLLGCSDPSGQGGGADAGSGTDASGGDDAATDAGGGWATGGTASMTGNYPDPFSSGLGTACALTCAATLGPCY